MAKINVSGTNIAFASRLFHCCLIVVALGPICHKTFAKPEFMSVTPDFKLAVGPVWDVKSQSVYFVGTTDKLLINYKPNISTTTVRLDDSANLKFLVPVSSPQTKFVSGYGGGIGLFSWNGTSTQTLSPENHISFFKDPNESLECGKTDSKGRLWVGSSYMDGNDMKGRLYLLDASGQATSKISNFGLGVPGGIAWNKFESLFYYSDATANMIYSFTFNTSTDEINDGVDFFNFASNNKLGPASSITIDSDGHLWVSSRKDSEVLKINYKDGSLLWTVKVPEARSVTSVAFGGKTLEELYVTTSDDVGLSGTFPKSGTLFHGTNTGSTGLAVAPTDVKWPKAA